MMKKIKLKINVPMLGNRKDDIISISAFDNNVPVNKFWRRRLKDSKKDNCVEIFKEKKIKAKTNSENNSTFKTLK